MATHVLAIKGVAYVGEIYLDLIARSCMCMSVSICVCVCMGNHSMHVHHNI